MVICLNPSPMTRVLLPRKRPIDAKSTVTLPGAIATSTVTCSKWHLDSTLVRQQLKLPIQTVFMRQWEMIVTMWKCSSIKISKCLGWLSTSFITLRTNTFYCSMQMRASWKKMLLNRPSKRQLKIAIGPWRARKQVVGNLLCLRATPTQGVLVPILNRRVHQRTHFLTRGNYRPLAMRPVPKTRRVCSSLIRLAK